MKTTQLIQINEIAVGPYTVEETTIQGRTYMSVPVVMMVEELEEE